MLDRLADKLEATVDSIGELRDSIGELRENQSSILEAFVQEHEDNRLHRLQYQQDRAEYLTWKKETDQRFNILLEEVRALGKKLDP